MRYAIDIQVEDLIVHMIDPWRPNGFVLSERTLPLAVNPRLAEYFAAHIQNSLKDPEAKAAQFQGIATQDTAGICQAMLSGELDLLDGSQQLAQRLYDIIAEDRRISSGALAVGFYRAENKPEVPRYLALLKIDPSEAFRHRTVHDPQGFRYINFEIQTDVMPTTRERLQKCAFIQPLDPRPEYDLILLDRQVRPPVPIPVAKYFAEEFLDAQLALDSRQRTDRLYRSLVSAHNQLRSELAPDQDEELSVAIDSAVAAPTINLDSWLDELPLPPKRKSEIDQVVSQEFTDREFNLDRPYARKLTSKRRFRGDGGLRVELSARSSSEVIHSVEKVSERGGQSYYRIVIHTRKWEEIP